MLQKCRKMLRNEKGLTLIELLAVVVILGIIAAIAIPSIGNIIEKSREDAHQATAQQVLNAARLAVTTDPGILKNGVEFSEIEPYLENFDKNKYTIADGAIEDDGKSVTKVTISFDNVPYEAEVVTDSTPDPDEDSDGE
ncbi:type II secretion system protein [Sutcliffiella horikoshii]|uniref:type II secretion system protein n=1 Tax=Sutcliffiella horikoshii TaxID=79883 RepID=UPI00384EEEED